MNVKKGYHQIIRIAIHLAALTPLGVLIFDFFAGRLTFNPIQAATRRSGDVALVILMVSLACTPASSLFGFRQAIRYRRTIGLYAFAYTALHLILFVGVDYQFDFGMLYLDLNQKYYIFIGLAAFVILLALAVTSFDAWKKRLGKAWKKLHRWVYIAAPLAILHYDLAKKGDLLNFRGEISWPLLALGILVLLYMVRLTWVKKIFHP
jgi:methionine sulfoxide reductase heme-binding subunit